MNKAKQSLEENKAEILAALPKEFHADFEKELKAMPNTTPPPPTNKEVVKAIKAELVANPNVDEKKAAAELKDIKAPEPLPPAEEK